MKAVKLTTKQTYDVVDIPEPVQDGNHVIIDVDYIAYCGSDLTIWKMGEESIFGVGNVIGHEYTGRVVDPGPRTDLKVGDRVTGAPLNYCNECFYCKNGLENLCEMTTQKGGPGVTTDGAMTPRFAIDADKTFKLNDDVDPRAAALTEPIANGHHAVVTRGKLQPGENVLIIGGGIIAILVAWWARKCGAGYIVMSEINPDRIAHLKETNMCDEVVNPLEEGAMAAVKEKVGEGFDAIFECSHPNETLYNTTVLGMLRKGGRIMQTGSQEGMLGLNFFLWQYKELTLVTCWSISKGDFEAAVKAVNENWQDFLPHITNIIALEDVQAMAEEMASGKTKEVKVLVDPNK